MRTYPTRFARVSLAVIAFAFLALICSHSLAQPPTQTPCGELFHRIPKDSIYRAQCDSAAVISVETYRRILGQANAQNDALRAVLEKRTGATERLIASYAKSLEAERGRNTLLKSDNDTCRARYDDLFSRYEAALETVSTQIDKSERTAREVRTQVVNLQFQVSEYEKALPRERRKSFAYGVGAGALVAILVGAIVVVSIR